VWGLLGVVHRLIKSLLPCSILKFPFPNELDRFKVQGMVTVLAPKNNVFCLLTSGNPEITLLTFLGIIINLKKDNT
jgi:uncharacterized ParB-like nuclease family protein